MRPHAAGWFCQASRPGFSVVIFDVAKVRCGSPSLVANPFQTLCFPIQCNGKNNFCNENDKFCGKSRDLCPFSRLLCASFFISHSILIHLQNTSATSGFACFPRRRGCRFPQNVKTLNAPILGLYEFSSHTFPRAVFRVPLGL